MSNPFGELRSLLQRPASEQLWEELCAMLDVQVARADESQWQEMMAYARGVLSHWPASMCMAPRRWVDGMFDGQQVPQLAATRAIDTRGRDVGDEQIFEMTLAKELAGLTELSMGFTNRVGWRPEKLDYGCVRELSTCAHLSNLRTIRLTGQHLLPDSFSSLLDRHNAFDVLDVLDFSFNDLNFMKPGELERITIHPITHLYLSHCNLNPQGAQALESSDVLDGIITLDLSGNTEIEPVDLIHMLGNEERGRPRLKSLHLGEMNLYLSHVAELLSSLTQVRLERLDLAGLVRDDGESDRILFDALSSPVLENLRHLNLENTGIARSGEELLRAWPARLDALESLCLRRTGLGAPPSEAGDVQDWLAHLISSGTRRIDLSYNEIDAQWIEHMLQAVDRSSSACTLCLDFNSIDPEDEHTAALRQLAADRSITLELDTYTPPFVYDEEYYEDTWEG